MTIEKGMPWGAPGQLPADGLVVRADAEAMVAITHARRSKQPLPVLGLAGGDLCRTVGGRGDAARMRGPEARTFPVDLGSALLDGRQYWFTSHCVARRSWWRGRIVAIMNAQWVGAWDVAPKSHPNDGLLDVFESDLSINDRLKALRRLPTGTHVPHPGIRQRRVAAAQFEFERRTPVYLDGERVGSARFLVVRVEADALTCVV